MVSTGILYILGLRNTYDSGRDASDGDGTRAVGLAVALGVVDGVAKDLDDTASRAGGGRALCADVEGGSAGDNGKDSGGEHVDG